MLGKRSIGDALHAAIFELIKVMGRPAVESVPQAREFCRESAETGPSSCRCLARALCCDFGVGV